MAASGTYRFLDTGAEPQWSNPSDADGALDAPGTPDMPIRTDLEGPWGIPWFDASENPSERTGLFKSQNPTYPDEDLGALPVVGAYDGAYRTSGPVTQWGHEPTGGMEGAFTSTSDRNWYIVGGDQALGRTMRFPANIPDRYDINGVRMPDYADELAAALAYNGMGEVTEAEYTTELVLMPGVTGLH